jgi:hypothetical protein
MKCFNYSQHLDPILDIKRGVGDGGYGDPDYSNIDVVSGNVQNCSEKHIIRHKVQSITYKISRPFPRMFSSIVD